MDKEYLMLREEIMLLGNIVNNTIKFFYVFVSAVLLFGITQEDSLYILISYIVIIPAYMLVASKINGERKIGAYLYVFHEGQDFNWETRNKKLYEKSKKQLSNKISSFNYPFFFVSTFVTIIFLSKTNWGNVGMTFEFLKITIAIGLYVTQLVLIKKNQKVTIDKYIPYWEEIKQNE